jgi:hypothetical protein
MTAPAAGHIPDPKRVASGKLSRARWRGFTADGLRRLREAALRNRPWEHSTGPKTKAGKAQSVVNGKTRQLGSKSVREVRNEIRDLMALVEGMREVSREISPNTLGNFARST